MDRGRVVASALAIILMAAGCQASGTVAPSAAPSIAVLPTTDLAPTERPSLSLLPAGTEAATPRASVSARPNPTATPKPTVGPWPSRSRWTGFGSIKTGMEGSVAGMRSVTAGYLAWGWYGSDKNRDPMFATWFSSDGRSWSRTVHAGSESVTAPASDGRTLVFTVTLPVPDAANSEQYHTVFLSTTDGRTWSRSEPRAEGVGAAPLADGGEGTLATVESLWAIPGGWEALVATEDRPSVTSDLDTPAKTIWRSSDLVTWATITSWPARVGRAAVFEMLGVAPDGTRLGASTEEVGETVRSTLLSSSDAITWKPARVLPAGFRVEDVVAPEKPGRPWLVAIQGMNEYEETARVLVSRDLVAWKTVPFAKPEIGSVEAVGAGWLAVGAWVAGGSATGAEIYRTMPYTSKAGLSWRSCSRCQQPGGAWLKGTDGVGHLVAISGEPSHAGLVRLWRLTLDS